jgi:hypothetical protein
MQSDLCIEEFSRIFKNKRLKTYTDIPLQLVSAGGKTLNLKNAAFYRLSASLQRINIR